MKKKVLLIIFLIIIFNGVLFSFKVFGVDPEAIRPQDTQIETVCYENESLISGIIYRIVQLLATVVGFFGIINVIKYLRTKKEDEEKRIKLRNKAIIQIMISIFTWIPMWMSSLTQSFKPVIYIYPEEEKDIFVKLKKPEKLTCTYPKYKDGWNVLAKPNGNLIEKETGRSYYSLYWEGKNDVKHDLTEGFIVEGKDAEKFLEEKLEVLGLNEREAQEFIIYWLPELEKNKYNFIRFETVEQINEDMPLEITPKPDTVIRIMMVSKKILIPYEVKEQKLEKVERKGFSVVEWGGTRI